jgi:hypothetical protein
MENEEITAFLLALHHATSGDPNVKKSMHEVGAAIGLDKGRAGKVAEEVISKGWAEIKTLSGGIGITAEGVEAALDAGAAAPGGNDPSLGAGPLLDAADRQAVERLLAQIKQGVAKLPPDYAAMEEMVIDIKTAEVHLLSPRARTAVMKEILDALRSVLADAGAREAADRIGRMLGR